MNLTAPQMSTDFAEKSSCIMAIELSKARWLIGMLTPLSERISLRSIPCGAVEEGSSRWFR